MRSGLQLAPVEPYKSSLASRALAQSFVLVGAIRRHGAIRL